MDGIDADGFVDDQIAAPTFTRRVAAVFRVDIILAQSELEVCKISEMPCEYFRLTRRNEVSCSYGGQSR